MLVHKIIDKRLQKSEKARQSKRVRQRKSDKACYRTIEPSGFRGMSTSDALKNHKVESQMKMVQVQQRRIAQSRRSVFMLSLAHCAETAAANVKSIFEMAKNMCPEPEMDNTMWKLHQDAISELKKKTL